MAGGNHNKKLLEQKKHEKKPYSQTCTDCLGAGILEFGQQCSRCNGTGRITITPK